MGVRMDGWMDALLHERQQLCDSPPPHHHHPAHQTFPLPSLSARSHHKSPHTVFRPPGIFIRPCEVQYTSRWFMFTGHGAGLRVSALFTGVAFGTSWDHLNPPPQRRWIYHSEFFLMSDFSKTAGCSPHGHKRQLTLEGPTSLSPFLHPLPSSVHLPLFHPLSRSSPASLMFGVMQ